MSAFFSSKASGSSVVINLLLSLDAAVPRKLYTRLLPGDFFEENNLKTDAPAWGIADTDEVLRDGRRVWRRRFSRPPPLNKEEMKNASWVDTLLMRLGVPTLLGPLGSEARRIVYALSLNRGLIGQALSEFCGVRAAQTAFSDIVCAARFKVVSKTSGGGLLASEYPAGGCVEGDSLGHMQQRPGATEIPRNEEFRVDYGADLARGTAVVRSILPSRLIDDSELPPDDGRGGSREEICPTNTR